jgi:hypothetical protein
MWGRDALVVVSTSVKNDRRIIDGAMTYDGLLHFQNITQKAIEVGVERANGHRKFKSLLNECPSRKSCSFFLSVLLSINLYTSM